MKEQGFFDLVRPAFGEDPKIEVMGSAFYEGCPSCDKGMRDGRLYDKIYSSSGLSVFVELELVDFKSLNSCFPSRRIISKADFERESQEYKRAWEEGRTNLLQSVQKEDLTMSGRGIPFYSGPQNAYSIRAVLVDDSEDLEMHSAEVVSAHAQYDPFSAKQYHLGRFNHPRDEEYLNNVLKGADITQELRNIKRLRNPSKSLGEIMKSRVVFGRELSLVTPLEGVEGLVETGREIARMLMKG